MDKKLKELWKPVGKMMLMDLPNSYYVVRFETERDYNHAFSGGPWTMFGHYLILKHWSPSFNSETDSITTSLALVRVTNLPFVYYEEGVLMRIASGIGQPLKVDIKTLFTN
ncbi:hypothetical protein V2J09_005924 [Rumex salicifolius]